MSAVFDRSNVSFSDIDQKENSGPFPSSPFIFYSTEVSTQVSYTTTLTSTVSLPVAWFSNSGTSHQTHTSVEVHILRNKKCHKVTRNLAPVALLA